MDRERADFGRTLEGLQKRFGRGVLPVQMPIGSEAGFTGLFSTAIFSSRAAVCTAGLRSAVIRIAGMVSPKRRRMSRMAAMPLPRSR